MIKRFLQKYEKYAKYRELAVYTFFGGLTTLINFAAFAAADYLGAGSFVSISSAWIISVMFAYVTNRMWVFKSRKTGIKNVLNEAASFFALRLGTYFLDLGIYWLLVDYFGLNSAAWKYSVKIAANVLVIAVNYLLSKLIVFRTVRKRERRQ